MYNTNDTIVAVSSALAGIRKIIRISGPDTLQICKRIFEPEISIQTNGIITGAISIENIPKVSCNLYIFFKPQSYTGQDLVELHVEASDMVVSTIIEHLLQSDIRMAGPGEFTARAYLNGKLDLVQAEAINEIIVSSNMLQLSAAEKLLSGKLAQISKDICNNLIDILSLIEAGLDFCEEDIELISQDQVIIKFNDIIIQLEQLLAGSIRNEGLIELASIGIAGAPNAGKSSLLNTLLGAERSIVSGAAKTTRDILSGILALKHCRCVLFDCAGLILQSNDIIDELAQQAAVEALSNSTAFIFCVDISKSDWNEDFAISKQINMSKAIAVATKCDLISKTQSSKRIAELKEISGLEFLPISILSGEGLQQLIKNIDERILQETKTGIYSEKLADTVTLTARHKQTVTNAISNLNEAVQQLQSGNNEIAAMMLRTTYKAISDIEQPIDEQMLDLIFSQFCIGK